MVDRRAAFASSYWNLNSRHLTVDLTRITSWIQSMGAALEEKGLDVIVTLPEPLERATTIASLF